ncbi:hypothetical protein EJ08DRAFT_580829 [Tothia fuscella]|uniref:ZW10 C-terminal helical domain-containing protein n=1 Tax=Tothia fuscella TaxID=1048955 RepID=A0A9P4NYX6_9PEZI|nr:hypothetical protein EJ08DRAFT_580829 [Tothia fuscella]
MSSSASREELSQAILQQVEYGAYPESDNVASADIPSDALPALLEAVGKARDSVKGELRELSRQSAPDIDGWISQAKQLQADIERSKATAREIVQEAEAGKTLNAHVEDATSKVELLRKELDFNVTLADTLEQLQIISGLLDGSQNAASEGDLAESLEKLGNAQKVIDQLDSFENTRFAGLVERRASQLRELLVAKVQEYWHGMVKYSSAERRITILNDMTGESGSMDLEQVVQAMAELRVLDSHISRLHRDLDAGVIGPRFTRAADGAVAVLEFGENTMQLSGRDDSPSAAKLAKDVKGMIDHLTKLLPAQALSLLLEKMLPTLITQLITDWLEPAVPVDPQRMDEFHTDLAEIRNLSDRIDQTEVSMPSDADLSEWLDRLPQTWLARRREAALTHMRLFCYDGVKTKKIAERVETQVISRDDVMVAGNQGNDDWDAGWDDEESAEKEDSPMEDAPNASEDEDVDADAWGLSEDGAKPSQDSRLAGEDGDDDAWGAWGEDEAAEEQEPSQPKGKMGPPPIPKTKANGSRQKTPQRTAERELTLRESFAITAIPDDILELVKQILANAETLSDPSFPIPDISTAAPALSSIPTLLLALYRATARTFYATDPAGDMLIYNDAQHMATSLQNLISSLPPNHPLQKRLQRTIEGDTKVLTTFSRQAYGREMDSQRTILTDLLSGTSGFANCTNDVNKREYSSALDDVAARLRQVDKTWKGILSDSARLQSLGTLLSHIIRQIGNDILELADEPNGISDEQSKVLKSFCDQIADLADLFLSDETGKEGEKKTLVHVYTPLWLRFGYLGEILEASLADIRFLWREGELSLEFEGEEVVGLVEALFAESGLRRDAIREIRGRR